MSIHKDRCQSLTITTVILASIQDWEIRVGTVSDVMILIRQVSTALLVNIEIVKCYAYSSSCVLAAATTLPVSNRAGYATTRVGKSPIASAKSKMVFFAPVGTAKSSHRVRNC